MFDKGKGFDSVDIRGFLGADGSKFIVIGGRWVVSEQGHISDAQNGIGGVNVGPQHILDIYDYICAFGKETNKE